VTRVVAITPRLQLVDVVRLASSHFEFDRPTPRPVLLGELAILASRSFKRQLFEPGQSGEHPLNLWIVIGYCHHASPPSVSMLKQRDTKRTVGRDPGRRADVILGAPARPPHPCGTLIPT